MQGSARVRLRAPTASQLPERDEITGREGRRMASDCFSRGRCRVSCTDCGTCMHVCPCTPDEILAWWLKFSSPMHLGNPKRSATQPSTACLPNRAVSSFVSEFELNGEIWRLLHSQKERVGNCQNLRQPHTSIEECSILFTRRKCTS